MTEFQITLWIMSAGFGLNFGLLLIIWNSLSKLDEKVTDIDRRLCRLEGAFSAKECCMIKDDSKLKKAE